MTNEEKKDFLAEIHTFYMERRPYDSVRTLEEMKRNEDLFWDEFRVRFCHRIPKSFFKYRKANDLAIRNLENDEAWFSHPIDFDDTMDSTVNNDIEAELRHYEDNPSGVTLELAKAFVKAVAAKYGAEIDPALVEEAFALFREDGSIDENDARKCLEAKMPGYAADECLGKLKQAASGVLDEQMQDAVLGFLRNFLDMNVKMRREFLVFSLAEEGDNQAMWGLYADESKGFCIEYSFPEDDFLAQRMLLNLFPIYYGQKPMISFFDVLIRGLYGKDKIHGITYADYLEWFVSSNTKDPSYKFQKEWRVTFDSTMGGSLQRFPFAVSITLGERMPEEDAKRLTEIAKKKGLKVYRRVMSKSGSHILTAEVV